MHVRLQAVLDRPSTKQSSLHDPAKVSAESWGDWIKVPSCPALALASALSQARFAAGLSLNPACLSFSGESTAPLLQDMPQIGL